MVKLFEICGYCVKSLNKKQNIFFNLIDEVLIFAYAVLSFKNICDSEPSKVTFYLNFIILSRFIVKNIIEQRKISKNVKGTNKWAITVMHFARILLEISFLSFALILYVLGNVLEIPIVMMNIAIFIVLVVTFFEDTWTVLERVYDAEPKPLAY